MSDTGKSWLHPKTTTGAVIRLPLKMIPKNKVMRIRSGPAKGMKWIVGSGIHGCWLGTYEMDKQAALRQYIKPGMTLYDIGANSGFYTLLFSILAGQEGKVYSFEPLASNAQHLVNHILVNGIKNASVVQAALGPCCGLVGFTVSHNNYQNHTTSASDTVLSVYQTTLDSFLSEPGVRPPDLLKIDVEGAESGVLSGAAQLLRSYRPVIFLALHGAEQARLCSAILQEHKYQLYDMQGGKIGPNIETDEIIALPEEI